MRDFKIVESLRIRSRNFCNAFIDLPFILIFIIILIILFSCSILFDKQLQCVEQYSKYQNVVLLWTLIAIIIYTYFAYKVSIDEKHKLWFEIFPHEDKNPYHQRFKIINTSRTLLVIQAEWIVKIYKQDHLLYKSTDYNNFYNKKESIALKPYEAFVGHFKIEGFLRDTAYSIDQIAKLSNKDKEVLKLNVKLWYSSFPSGRKYEETTRRYYFDFQINEFKPKLIFK